MGYKATVILACYNKEKYIARALDSVIAQSRFEEFEVIAVDDCSQDATAEIIRSYADRYDNISLIELDKGSGGPSKPRNMAIERSTADYLIMMDPDDEVINDGYSLLLTKMEEYQSDILIGTRVGVTQGGVRVFTDFISEEFTFVNQNTPEIQFELLYRPPFIQKTIYRKALLDEHGIRYNEKISTSEDESFDLQCVAYAEKITKINDIVYRKTVDADGSITTGVKLRMYEEMYDVLLELDRTYRLMFSDAVRAGRIMALMHVFYIPRLAFMGDYDDIARACECLYDAFERFGSDKLEALEEQHLIELRDALYARDISDYVQRGFYRRVNVLEKRLARTEARLGSTDAKLKKTRRQLKRARKLLDNPLVKPGAALAKGLGKLRRSSTAKG